MDASSAAARIDDMPSFIHESLVDLFRHRPDLAPALMRRAGVELPDAATPRVTSAELVDLNPAEYRADVVVRLDQADGSAAEAIIVEVQLERDGKKRQSWPWYMAGVHAKLDCLATLLVVTIDSGIAAWCARPIALDRNGSVIRPLVLGPETLPHITDFEQARQLPELAVLSAAAHGNEDDAAEIAMAGLSACSGLDSQRATRYADFILASLGEAARRALEELMSVHKYEYQSDFAKKYFNEGREEGRDEGLLEGRKRERREVLLKLLTQRFGDIPARVRDRIEHADMDELQRWTERFVPAMTLMDIFDGK